MRILPLAALFSLASWVPAVELRVASFNIGAHFATTFFDYSLGNPGTVDHESVKAILARLDADVVALQEIHSVDLQGNPDDLESLAAALGYPHIHVPPNTGVFDTSLKVVILSRFPFLSSGNIGSTAPAKELTRHHPVVKVDVPGTANDPVIISTHLKAGTTTAERFRRAVEMKRLVGHLATEGLTADDNFIILGDFNPSGTNTSVSYTTYLSFFDEPNPDLPGTYVVGSDVVFPVAYSTNPLAYFTSPMPVRLDPRQLDGSDTTYGTTFANGPTLDLFLVSPAIAGRPHASEVYNSTLDVSNSTGLPKAGSPLADNTSTLASDHYAVFADFELDSDLPNLDLTLTATQVVEESADGTVMANVTIPAVKPSAVTVSISSDDAAAFPISSTVVIPAGSLTASVAIRTPRDFLNEGLRSVSFVATSNAHDPDTALLQVVDIDGPYVFTAPGQTVVEDFDGFNGNHDPAPWTSAEGSLWLGVDDGSSSAAGFRAYGVGTAVSPGFVNGGGSAALTASFRNQSSTTMTALRISLDAAQWRSAANGAEDSISAELVVDGIVTPLPGITFVASQVLPPGAVSSPDSNTLTATATGLSIPPGSEFELRLHFTPGAASSALPADVFINEIHYDNASTDTGEFIEIAVGPGFTGNLADVTLQIYNGANGQTNGAHTLDSFTLGATTASGHRLIHKSIPNLENGPDGMALVYGGSVMSFISYEGSFTATNGPASGMTSVNVNVTQSGSDPVGLAAIGLFGSGGAASDFAWKKFTGVAHSPGAANDGQSFIIPTLQPQGLAIDNVSVTYLTDTDLDGLPDESDPDDDNDSQPDAAEIAFGSNPLSAASRFAPVIAPSPSGPHALELVFPGASGKIYTVEASGNLSTWEVFTTVSGNGQPIVLPLPMDGNPRFFRVTAPISP